MRPSYWMAGDVVWECAAMGVHVRRFGTFRDDEPAHHIYRHDGNEWRRDSRLFTREEAIARAEEHVAFEWSLLLCNARDWSSVATWTKYRNGDTDHPSAVLPPRKAP